MQIIGHRGARGLAPENTIAAIKAGLTCGVDAIEVDVRVTKDSQPVLFHGKSHRYRGKKTNISDITLKELKNNLPDLATLNEAVITVDRNCILMIEIKPDVRCQPIIDQLKMYLRKGWTPADFYLASYDTSILRNCRQQLPEIRRIVLERWSGIRAAYKAHNSRTDHIAMNHLWLWGGFIRSLQRQEKQLYCYTMNNPTKIRRFERYGIAGVITDYPDRYKRR